ncbi:MAG: hypothetical protein ACI855_003514 [Myxococcota bacterium]|jgi:hypothetical protein
MSKRGLIVGGGLFALLGIGCLGLTTLVGVGAWWTLSPISATSMDREYGDLGDLSASAVTAEPMVSVPATAGLGLHAEGTDMDTEADTDSDSVSTAQETTGSVAPSPRPRRIPTEIAQEHSPFPSPSEAFEAIPEEENLDDMDLERTAIEVIDEDLTPRERRRLRREERD